MQRHCKTQALLGGRIYCLSAFDIENCSILWGILQLEGKVGILGNWNDIGIAWSSFRVYIDVLPICVVLYLLHQCWFTVLVTVSCTLIWKRSLWGMEVHQTESRWPVLFHRLHSNCVYRSELLSLCVPVCSLYSPIVQLQRGWRGVAYHKAKDLTRWKRD